MSTQERLSTQTRTTPSPAISEGTQPVTTQPVTTQPAARAAHRHAWRTESSHHTSEGLISYVRCLACDERRVELRALAAHRTRV